MALDDEGVKEAIREAYLSENPTSDTNSEILKKLGEDFQMSANSIRVFLAKENILVKKAQVETGGTKSPTTGTKRVSKEKVLGQLKELISSKGKPIDNDILDKLTGKAAQYLIEVIS